VHAPSEEKSDDSKVSFYEDLENFLHYPKYHMKILLGNFNAKVGGGNILNPSIGSVIYITILGFFSVKLDTV